jgi:4a-hydroxytetrahydrobiopterin dehydratase
MKSTADLNKPLADELCEACRADAPRLTKQEIRELEKEVPDWDVVERDGISILTRCYTFKNFFQALAFTNLVGRLAESMNHHPALLTEWGKVKVEWWTHKIKGLHRNDFVMAAKTEKLFEAKDWEK